MLRRRGAEHGGQTLLNPATMHLAVTYDSLTFKGYGFTWWLNLPTGKSAIRAEYPVVALVPRFTTG